MTSEWQIAANRRNAQKSTGPRSESGKKRSSKNAYRHGLAVPISTVEIDLPLQELVLSFAGDTDDADVRVLAEIAARAQLELARAKKVRTEMIELALDVAPQRGQYEEPPAVKRPKPRLADPMYLPGGQDGQRLAEAIQPILPELSKTERYTQRAAGQRDRAIREIFRVANKGT